MQKIIQFVRVRFEIAKKRSTFMVIKINFDARPLGPSPRLAGFLTATRPRPPRVRRERDVRESARIVESLATARLRTMGVSLASGR